MTMRTCKTIEKHLTEYGNVRVIEGVPRGLRHIGGRRLGPLCRKLGIPFADALVGFEGSRSRGWHPSLDGVVVPTRSASKVEAAKAARDAKAEAERPRREEEARLRRNRREAEKLAMRRAEVEAFKSEILECYPRMPSGDALNCAWIATEPGRVADPKRWLAFDGIYDSAEVVRRAVIAYVRHNKTSYEELLDQYGGGEFARDSARDDVREDIGSIMSQWEPSPSERGSAAGLALTQDAAAS